MPALRVAIDLTALEQPDGRALARSRAVRFAEALIQHASGLEFHVLARPATYAALAFLDAPNARRLAVAAPSGAKSRFARLEARVERRLQRSGLADRLPWLENLGGALASWRPDRRTKQRPDVLFCPFTSLGVSDRSVPLVVAVDDLQHLSHPHLLSSREQAARARAFNATCHRAARIVCSTPPLRDVAVQCDGILAERVLSVAPGRLLARPAAIQPDLAATLARYGLEDNQFCLVVADFEPRHNHRVVLTALAIFQARFPHSKMRLVCVGGPDASIAASRSAAEQMGLGRSVVFPGALGPDETSTLIQTCRALVVPSLYETVGETLLEAMQLGRPAVCSQIPALANLTGGAALMFDAHRPPELAAAFECVERDPGRLDRLAQLGRERAASLDDAASITEAYVGVLREARTTCPPSR